MHLPRPAQGRCSVPRKARRDRSSLDCMVRLDFDCTSPSLYEGYEPEADGRSCGEAQSGNRYRFTPKQGEPNQPQGFENKEATKGVAHPKRFELLRSIRNLGALTYDLKTVIRTRLVNERLM